MKKVLSACASGMNRVSRFFGLVTGLFILAIVFITSFEVVMRYVFNMPTTWVLDISTYLFIYSVYLGASYVQLREGHVKVDLLTVHLPFKAQVILKVVAGVMGLVFCAFFIWGGWDQALNAYVTGYNSGTLLNAPLAPIMVIIPIGIFLLSIQLIVSMSRAGNPGMAEGEDMYAEDQEPSNLLDSLAVPEE